MLQCVVAVHVDETSAAPVPFNKTAYRIQVRVVNVLQCVAVCYCVLQCVTVCCSVLQCVVAVGETSAAPVPMNKTALCSYGAPYSVRVVLQCVAVCCSVLQCVAVCCSVLQCVAACCIRCVSYSRFCVRANLNTTI